ncbi:MAG: ATP-binding cassette domain-containing protein [Pseudomonadota bacterium]
MADARQDLAARLVGVTKRLGDTAALADLSLDIPGTGGTAVVGESGSGKSTLLGLLIGLMRPDSGRVDVLGEPLTDANLIAVRRKLGYAVQETGLFPHLSVRDNIALPARLRDTAADGTRERIERLAAMLNLDTALLERYPLALSGGQRQRAGICRAMLLQPRLLLLDEPFSGLDIVTRREIYARFTELMHEEQTAFVLVTHDLNEAQHLCRRIAVLNRGELVACGDTEALLAEPPAGYVAELVAAHRLHDATA